MMDGFYIEVRNRGSNEKGIKIRSESKIDMEDNIRQYERSRKHVIVLGEYKNELWLS
jgi:type IV secretory pathway ATPase VirB11/archaellum biosynthesis ATPase